MNEPNDDAWLARPESIQLLWRIFWAILALTVVLQLVVKVKGSFGIDGWFGFGAAFGFLCCVAMVVVAKVLGYILKRDENYYRGEQLGDD